MEEIIEMRKGNCLNLWKSEKYYKENVRKRGRKESRSDKTKERGEKKK